MTKWPVSGNRSWDIVSGSPQCCACEEPAERFVSVQWNLGQYSEHPVCGNHLQQYRADFDRLAGDLRRLARQSRSDAEGEGTIAR